MNIIIKKKDFSRKITFGDFSDVDVAFDEDDISMNAIDGLPEALDDKVDDIEKGAPDGVATLDNLGVIPIQQVPVSDELYDPNLWNGDLYPATKNAIRGKIVVIDQSLVLKLNVADVVDNLVSTDIDKPLSANQGKQLNDLLDSKIDDIEKGALNGVATLDGAGKVPSAQLPSYVDDVEEYVDSSSFPLTGESGKIYIALDTNLTYRWSGATYIQVGLSSVDLAVSSISGTTLDITCSAGTDATIPSSNITEAGLQSAADKIKLDGIADNATANQTDTYLLDRVNHTGTQTASTISDFDSAVTSSTHVGYINNPHSVTQTQVGLGNVDNTSDADKPVSIATQNALDDKVSGVPSTDNAITRFDGVSGAVKDSRHTITDDGNTTFNIDRSDGAALDFKNINAANTAWVGLNLYANDGSPTIERKGYIGAFSTNYANSENHFRLNHEKNGPMTFFTNNLERLRISPNGNTLVGTAIDDGSNKLQVNGDVAAEGQLTSKERLLVKYGSNTNDPVYLGFDPNAAFTQGTIIINISGLSQRITNQYGGNVKYLSFHGHEFQGGSQGSQVIANIGGANGNKDSEFYSSVTATAFIISSDSRVKANIVELNNGWYSYSLKTDKDKRVKYGVIAQEIQKTNPELVYGKDKLSVDYTSLFALKLAEKDRQILELIKRIEALEKSIYGS